MHPRCGRPDCRECARSRRIEIVSTGIDEALQGLGSDPYGDINAIGLRVPAFATARPDHRYLFQLASFTISDGQKARIRGFRHGYSLGFAQLNEQAGTRRVVEQWIDDPFYQPQNGNVSWHMRVMAIDEPQIPNPGSGPQQPPLANFPFRTSDTPGLLYLTAGFPVGIPVFYTALTAYQPPNGGMPWGRPLTGELGTFYDLKTPWRDAQAWHSLDIPLDGPCRVVFYASVQQIDLQTRVPLVLPAPLLFPGGVSAIEQFLQLWPNAKIWRVAGALVVELDCSEAP